MVASGTPTYGTEPQIVGTTSRPSARRCSTSGSMLSMPSWLAPTSAIDSQKSETVERKSATRPRPGAPSHPRRIMRRRPRTIVGGQRRTESSPARIAIAAPVTVPTSSRYPGATAPTARRRPHKCRYRVNLGDVGGQLGLAMPASGRASVGLAGAVAGDGFGACGDRRAEQGGGGDGSICVQAGAQEASGLELVIAPAAWTEIRHGRGAAGPGLVVVQIAAGREAGAVIRGASRMHRADVFGDGDGGFVGVGLQVG